MGWNEEQQKQYAEDLRNKGYSEDFIRQNVNDLGWDYHAPETLQGKISETVSGALNKVNPSSAFTPTWSDPFKGVRNALLLAGLLVLALIVGISYMTYRVITK